MATVTMGACVLASSGEANAANVVPGADTASLVVVTDDPSLTVRVNAADAAATEITGTVANTSQQAFTCAGAQAKDSTGGDSAPADLVAKSVDYYRKNLYRVLPQVPINSPSLPIIGAINLGTLDLGSSSDTFQGLGSVLGQANQARKEIAQAYSDARVAGHAGQIPAFTVKPGETASISAALPAPSSGPRTDFNAATFLMCTRDDTKQPYVFAGYEDGRAAPKPSPLGSVAEPLGSSNGLSSSR